MCDLVRFVRFVFASLLCERGRSRGRSRSVWSKLLCVHYIALYYVFNILCFHGGIKWPVFVLSFSVFFYSRGHFFSAFSSFMFDITRFINETTFLWKKWKKGRKNIVYDFKQRNFHPKNKNRIERRKSSVVNRIVVHGLIKMLWMKRSCRRICFLLLFWFLIQMMRKVKKIIALVWKVAKNTWDKLAEYDYVGSGKREWWEWL